MSKNITSDDHAWMARALALAARARGRVEPNPMVGCVIVRRQHLVGQGYHRRFGGPHAEVDALRDAGSKARKATVYVTLEPCCHHGKTPPCTDALIAAGVSRVIIAMRDRFPPVAGRGVGILRSAGIEVVTGLCENQAALLNAPYIKLRKTGRPYVILKWAQSLDGKIATRSGDSRWISGEESRRRAHQIRGRVDAVIVGVGTAIADDPDLTCRHGRPRRVATRIVIDPHLRTPPRARLVRTAADTPTIIATDRRVVRTPRARALEHSGVEIVGLTCSKRTGLNLGQLLDTLGDRQMTNVMVEGGGKTLGAFFDAGLADEAVIFVARKLIGGQQAPSPLSAKGPKLIANVPLPVSTKLTHSGQDDIYQLRFS